MKILVRGNFRFYDTKTLTKIEDPGLYRSMVSKRTKTYEIQISSKLYIDEVLK